MRVGRQFHIDSSIEARSSGNEYNFVYDLDFKGEPFTHCAVIDASVPKSYYAIQEAYRTFTLRQGASSYTVSISAGNYGVDTFSAALEDALNTVQADGYVYTIIPNVLTGRFAYSVEGAVSQPIFEFDETSMYTQMGFAQLSSNQFAGDTLTSSTVINLAPESTLFLRSDIAQNVADDVLLSINASGIPPYGVIKYTLSTDLDGVGRRLAVGESGSKSHARFYLTNENPGIGRQLIDLNGINMTFTLYCWYETDKSDLILKGIYTQVRDTRLLIETSFKTLEDILRDKYTEPNDDSRQQDTKLHNRTRKKPNRYTGPVETVH